MNCNDCKNIDYTEQDQHYRGIEIIPEHHCKYYNTRIYHLNHHSGWDYYIYPCSQCVKDKYKYFEKRDCCHECK